MEGVESKPMVTGDDSQINSAISICLEEHVQGFEQCAKEILKLIEQDGSFSEMTSEVNDDKRCKLSTHVTELLRMHGVLVNQHVQLIKKQHLDACDSSSPQVTQMFTPDQMSNTQKFRTPIGFDVLSSCGGGSYASRKEGSESSFSLSSDSDSDSFISTNKLLISPGGDDSLKVKDATQKTVLLQKISALEDEVGTLNAKVQTLSHENANLKHEIEKNESDIKTKNTRFENEKTKAIELEKQVSELKLMISDANLQIETMGDELNASRKKLLVAEDEITLLNAKIDRSTYEISLLESARKADIERLQMEIMEKCRLVDDLNKNLDGLQLKKDGVTAQLDTLRAEKSCQDDLVRELETRLDLLQLEHERVLSSFDNAERVTNELKLKVVELESEVEVQREVMSVRAEEKREAIRQLSFSLEHYMSGYKQLRRAFVVGNRRRTVFSF